MPAVLMESITACSLNRGPSWLEVECVDGGAATVYVLGALTRLDALELERLPHCVPPAVHTLRVQLRPADADPATMDALRRLVRAWQHRGTAHLVFVPRPRGQRESVPATAHHNPLVDGDSAAMTAVFL